MSAPETAPKALAMRKNGKTWHQDRKPFRPAAGLTSYAKRLETRKLTQEVKALEAEMKEEKDAKRQKWVDGIKARREAKVDKERYAKLAEKMHKKRVERIKRREKRNKLLNS